MRYNISCYPWGNEYTPESYVDVETTGESLKVTLTSHEAKPKAVYFKKNDPVCCDSCLEFFIKPFEDDNSYINFEFNANGTSLIGVGAPGNRTNIDRRDFNIVANQYADKWSISFEIKYSVIEELYSRKIEVPHKASFNAYKCGDETAQPHWGCVFPVEYFEPSFHRPEFFGEIILK